MYQIIRLGVAVLLGFRRKVSKYVTERNKPEIQVEDTEKEAQVIMKNYF